MAVPALRARLAGGEKIFAGWMASAYPRMAEMLGRVGFDAVIVDLQHGEAAFTEARDAIVAAHLVGKPAGIRAGLEAFGEAARLLDCGAEFVILPMINSAADARRLVDTLKYPPVGGRSWGPTRAVGLFETDAETYRARANDDFIVLAMIETRQAVEAMEDILDVPGLDGVFVGPSDLSISLSDGARLDHRMPESVAVMERLLVAAKARRKVTAIFCSGGEAAARNAAMGFDIMAVGSDWAFFISGAQAALKAARGDDGKKVASY
ncbi:HpcH/HpaI aldolase family protein [Labrys monachus]|uniref:4-hydroxy-2-oxoheptanedioate aldolase n=1 Tax=Labrys monachus TaxID=217067 RepID=A0ABU0FIX2_9HYPH|nr:aldolase/citrate lyase family protein [Labrys monachus]MDQ0394023.1 4-hydroxy-2-oxoheptanedioate aldolase [Labrys monachus]